MANAAGYYLAAWWALICCGLDLPLSMLNRNKRRDLPRWHYGLSHPYMHQPVNGKPSAWTRVREKPWSITHDWVNVITTWYEVPGEDIRVGQEPLAKLTGFILLVHGGVCLIIGYILGIL